MRVYITSYWDTKGLVSVECERNDPGLLLIRTEEFPGCLFELGVNCFADREEANNDIKKRADAEAEIVRTKLGRLKAHLARLEHIAREGL